MKSIKNMSASELRQYCYDLKRERRVMYDSSRYYKQTSKDLGIMLHNVENISSQIVNDLVNDCKKLMDRIQEIDTPWYKRIF